MILFQLADKFSLHLLVDVTVAGESLGAFGVPGELADKVRVLQLFVQIANETATRHMRAGNFVHRMLFLFPCGWIQRCYDAVQAGIALPSSRVSSSTSR